MAEAAAAAPRVLLLGGCGFIGRSVLKYLLDYQLASKIRVVDKCLPSMAFLSDEFKQCFERKDIVEYVQGNLSNPEHIQRAFNDSTGEYEIVFNLASETKYNQPESIYEQHIVVLRRLCAQEASRRNVVKYIDVSTAQIYDSLKPALESTPPSPWTMQAKYHLEAENFLKTLPTLNYIILRLPIVYGPGDREGLMPRILCAAVYQYEEEKLEFLWGDSLRMNTVHVQDVAACLWYLVCCGIDKEVYNIVDESDLTQGKFNKILESLFTISASCKGSLLSTAAKALAPKLISEINTNHMAPWQELCDGYKIENTPLTPYIHKELLLEKACAVNGEKLKQLGFTLSCPQITAPILRDTIQYWITLGKFPPVLKSG